MGSSISFLDNEMETWTEHKLVYDHAVRKDNVILLKEFIDGNYVFLGYEDTKYMNVSYQHWFVTDKKRFLEFGGPGIDIYLARVQINTSPRTNYKTTLSVKMDSKIRVRMSHVIGMANYSLCFRNCEHVANYVFGNKWDSAQMHERGTLMSLFAKYMMGDHKRLNNTFPSTILPNDSSTEKIYDFINEHYIATRFEYYLDYNEDSYNILVLGPTGSGKSHLINIFFNQEICASDLSHHSLTKEIGFVRGYGQIYDAKTKRIVRKEIVVTDTVGICDSEWNDSEVLNLIKNRVSSNFKYIDAVFFVFKADRLPKPYADSIRNLMNWLGYYNNDNHLKFLFVGTFSEFLSDEKKQQLKDEASEILQLRKTDRDVTNESVESLVYVGFPPKNILEQLTKPSAGIEKSWKCLQPLLLNGTACDQLDAPTNFNLLDRRISLLRDKASCTIL